MRSNSRRPRVNCGATWLGRAMLFLRKRIIFEIKPLHKCHERQGGFYAFRELRKKPHLTAKARTRPAVGPDFLPGPVENATHENKGQHPVEHRDAPRAVRVTRAPRWCESEGADRATRPGGGRLALGRPS